MTREGIIRMAREACDKDKVDAWENGFWTITQEELERFAKLVAEEEREACADIAEKQRYAIHVTLTSNPVQNGTAVGILNRIRARGHQ